MRQNPISRRSFLKIATIAGLGSLARKTSAKQTGRTVKTTVPKKQRTLRLAENPMQSVQRTIPPKLAEGLKVYRPGATSEELCKAYGVAHINTSNFKPSESLMHDIKVLVVKECEKYNSKSDFNQKGDKLVDPYDVLAIMRVESGFNFVRDSKNGKGLLQLTSIAKRDIESLPHFPVKIENDFDPAQNIAGGVRYIVRIKTDFLRRGNKSIQKIASIYRLGPQGASVRQNSAIAASYAANVVRARKNLVAQHALDGYI
jgi:hypothetical protein